MKIRTPKTTKSGFTLIELLVVIAIMAILASILIPALGRAREQARKALCGTNMHHLGVGLRMYSTENRDWLPVWGESENWLWDVSYYTTDLLMGYGCDRKAFYCASNPTRSPDLERYWQFTQYPGFGPEPTNPTTRRQHFRVTGFCWLVDKVNGRQAPIRGVPERTFIKKMNVEYPEDWELVTDTTISRINSTDHNPPNTFTELTNGGIWARHQEYDRSNHIKDGVIPEGGQILFADGHVAWRDFSAMQMRWQAGGMPYFWW